jgi:hypothetical protein
MTFNKISRAGLLALAFGLLLGLFINIGLHDAAFAQTQDATCRRRGRGDSARLRCDGG